jgi:hypothetical protein
MFTAGAWKRRLTTPREEDDLEVRLRQQAVISAALVPDQSIS